MFRFRLQPVLNLRANVEQEKKRELGLAVQKLVAAQDVLAGLKEERKRVAEESDRRMEWIPPPSGEEMRLYDDFFAGNEENQRFQERRIRAEMENVERKREDLVLAIKDRRSLEILRERRYFQYDREIRRKDQAQLDEIGATRRNVLEGSHEMA